MVASAQSCLGRSATVPCGLSANCRRTLEMLVNLPARLLVAVATLALALAAVPAHARAGTVGAESAWTRATVPGQPAGGAFLTLRNRGAADRLVGARSAAAERVELHSMSMDGDVMRMRQIDAIDLPAGASVALAPGGLHLMLMGLKQPLKAGASVPLTLRFEKAGEVAVTLKVEAAGKLPGAAPHAH